MTPEKPAKPWRVYGTRLSTEHRSARAAYEAVATLTKMSVEATVYHWENGTWRLYENVEPQEAQVQS